MSSAAVAAITSFVIGWLWGDGSPEEWLQSAGGALEFWGILLVASPELAPSLRRLGTARRALWAAQSWFARRASNWGLRMLGRRPRTQVVSIEGAMSAEASGTARLSVGVREGASMEEKIAFLLRRDKETQDRLADLQEKLNDLPQQWGSDIKATARALRQEQEQGLAELRDEHLPERIWGVIFLLVGLFLATGGNLA